MKKDKFVKPDRQNGNGKRPLLKPSTTTQDTPQAPLETTLSSNPAQLQQIIGNRAIGRLLFQRKMMLGPVGDKYEQEADAVASQVMASLASQAANQPTSQPPAAQRQEEEELQMKPLPAISALQRQGEEEEELQAKSLVQRQEGEEELQAKSLVQRQEEEELQAKRDPMLEGGVLGADIEGAVQSARAGGHPLPVAARAPMEQAFGADFSGVKVHTDGQADALNRSLQARAFTTGQDIFFRSGAYNPTSRGGQELIAHELTHVVQQNGNTIRRKGIEPGDALPTMQEMTAAHLKTQLGLEAEQTTREDAIANYIALHELAHAQANIKNPLFMMTLFNAYVTGKNKKIEDYSVSFVDDFVQAATPMLASAATMRDAKNSLLRAVARQNPEYASFGSQFFAATSEYTQKLAEANAPAARDEKVLATQYLAGRQGVQIAEQLTSKQEKKAFGEALKKMTTVQLLLNPPKSGLSGMGQGWKGGGSVADSGNIVEEPPETGNPAVRTNIDNGTFAKNLEAANQFIKFIVEPQLLREIPKPEIHVHLDYSSGPKHPKGFRAFQSGKTVHVAQNEDTAIIVHEIGHYLESHLPTDVWHDIRLLIEQRHKAAGGGTVALQGAGGKKDKEGRFAGEYGATGKYTSRAYASGDSEMMSMTLEYFAAKGNAKEMIENDPQQAALILRGVRPKEYASTNELRPFDKYLPQ